MDELLGVQRYERMGGRVKETAVAPPAGMVRKQQDSESVLTVFFGVVAPGKNIPL